VHLPAEHCCYADGAQPLREREDIVIQVSAALGQGQLARKGHALILATATVQRNAVCADVLSPAASE
jgi:hypothetical protein